MAAEAAGQQGGGGSKGLTYKEAGVDIDAGAELVRRIAKMNPDIGGFGGLFPFGDHYLVAGTDGVGTKLKLAFEMDRHDTIGIDLVAMSVNDIVTSGARPLFFLDYFATSALDVDRAELVIKGIVDGCNQCDCKLLGGETAEMPGFYSPDEYDLSGFAVGAVRKDRLIDGSRIRAGDKLIGLPSSGPHSNGYSLIRRVVKESGASLRDPLPGSENGKDIGSALLEPTIIYVNEVLAAAERVGVKGAAHITGGGITENLPRVLPEGVAARVRRSAWELPPVFRWLQSAAPGRGIDDAEMLKTFNCGIGMILVVDPEAARAILAGNAGISRAIDLGDVVAHDQRVVIYVD
eukprot:jgi/Chlat1/7392/Chrsp6S00593